MVSTTSHRRKREESQCIIASKKFSAIAANAINGSAHNARARRKVAMSTSTGVYALPPRRWFQTWNNHAWSNKRCWMTHVAYNIASRAPANNTITETINVANKWRRMWRKNIYSRHATNEMSNVIWKLIDNVRCIVAASSQRVHAREWTEKEKISTK